MRKTRKYPFMFGSKRKNKFNRKQVQTLPINTCFHCVSEPVCFESLIP